ncbi:MAPEG family protein [Methylobacterium sp. J-068]|uniref:MAPEG family protein n=1 Tax=Methylobacterium sp. J-068 TaxID=2836649 RepID=UPI001FBABA1B|nr:MAPEG family protein [Methylobacterium sp. J-068]MCJ2034356.1 MAPEG family protein [Methylobacterium sp. J-068]
MPVEIRLLAWSCLLGLVHIVAASASGLRQRGGFGWASGNREGKTPEVTGAAARLEKASKNFFETFPIFAALVLACVATGRHNTAVVLGAYLYFFARLVYLPVYGFGVPKIRSIVWGVAIVGILFVLWGLFIKLLPYTP